MKVKLSHFERVAGLFILGAFLGGLAMIFGVAVKKGWFASRVQYHFLIASADGLHAGTLVQMAGLKVGAVEEVELISSDQVKVTMSVYEKFRTNIREGSSVLIIRPFIIGEKAVEITLGPEAAKLHLAEAALPVLPSVDIMDMLSGRTLGPFLGTLEALSTNLKVLLEAFADRRRIDALVRTLDHLHPLVKDLSTMSRQITMLAKQANTDKRFEKILLPLASVMSELDQILPQLNDNAPALGKELGEVVANMNHLTRELNLLTPAITAIAPDLPKTTLRAVEALNEAVVLLKAMQKSFFFRSNVEKVKDEESSRTPASAPNAHPAADSESMPKNNP